MRTASLWNTLVLLATAALVVGCSDDDDAPLTTDDSTTSTIFNSTSTSTEWRDTSTEPRDTSTEPRDTSTEPRDTSTEPRDSSSTEPRDSSTAELGTIADVIEAFANDEDEPEFTILLDALQEAGLVDLLADGEAEFTVFAPTDEAFDALLTELDIDADTLLDDEELEDILLYHVLAGMVFEAEAISTGSYISAQESLLWVNSDDGVVLNGDAEVTEADVEASNGVIHVIDAVLLRPDTLSAMIEAAAGDDEEPEFTILLQALQATELDALLDSIGVDDGAPFTAFAPTDAAFEALFAETEGIDDVEDLLALDDLDEILLYHVISGIALTSDVVAEGLIPTAADLSAWASIDNDDLRINGATVVEPNARAANGVAHAVDSVLLPLDLIELNEFAGLFDTLIVAFGEDGADIVADIEALEGNFTLFAPTDDAFDELVDDLEDVDNIDELLELENLEDILLYHIHSDAPLLASELEDGDLAMENGNDALVDADELTIAGAAINPTLINIRVTGNVIVHGMDDVMLPPSE